MFGVVLENLSIFLEEIFLPLASLVLRVSHGQVLGGGRCFILRGGGGLIHQKVEIYGVHCAPFEIGGGGGYNPPLKYKDSLSSFRHSR